MTYPVTYGPPPVLAPRDPMPVERVAYPQMLRTAARDPRSRRAHDRLLRAGATCSSAPSCRAARSPGTSTAGATTVDDVLAMRLDLTPALLVAVNLSNAARIPLSMLLQRAFFGQRGRWLQLGGGPVPLGRARPRRARRAAVLGGLPRDHAGRRRRRRSRRRPGPTSRCW